MWGSGEQHVSKLHSTDDNVIDGNMDEFNKKSNKSHDQESEASSPSNLGELCELNWPI